MCPDELGVDVAGPPEPPADAEIRANAAGAAWLVQLVAFGLDVAALLQGARAQCPPASASPIEGRP